MKRKVLAGLIMGLALLMSGCGNYDHFDTVWTYDYAIMELPDGRIIEGDVEQWRDYEGDVIQLRMDGCTYYIHTENVVLMSTPDSREPWDAEMPTMPMLKDK